ncbi:hypothetical protein CspHIS471_0300560 [Cutaneotrichosporon sp. HIS471]|nr:hypothetical protein CspHIS471_0300560 [Cutaneotrichosporon sp. HIS471]
MIRTLPTLRPPLTRLISGIAPSRWGQDAMPEHHSPDTLRPKANAALTPPPLAFSRAELNAIRSRLNDAPTMPLNEMPPHTCKFDKRPPRDSGVLIPLANIGGVAHIIVELRAAALRVHASEASFPGGKVEEGDANVVQTALRETEEELSLPMANIEVLGALTPEYSLGNKARVWPIIGFVHPSDAIDAATESAISGDATARNPLPSINLSTLHPDPGEVSGLIPLPLSAVADPSRQAAHYFRLDGRRPYWKIRCGDLIHPPPEEAMSLEVWGLTGWFLTRFAEQMGWSDRPPVSLPPTED